MELDEMHFELCRETNVSRLTEKCIMFICAYFTATELSYKEFTTLSKPYIIKDERIIRAKAIKLCNKQISVFIKNKYYPIKLLPTYTLLSIVECIYTEYIIDNPPF